MENFIKAGKPGWASIVPLYNLIVMLNIAGKPAWWILLYFIPLINIVPVILTIVGLAKNFGKGGGFAAVLIFLYPILAFGEDEYNG